MTLHEAENAIIEEFSMYEEWLDKYEYLIELGKAIGAITMGCGAGAFLGGTAGLCFFIMCCTGLNPMGPVMMGLFPLAPLLLFIVCVPTRLLTGFFCGLIYKGLRKTRMPASLPVAVAGISAPAMNTILFLTTLTAFFFNTEPMQQFTSGTGIQAVFTFIAAMAGTNAIIEIIVCPILIYAVSIALLRLNSRIK